MSSRPTLPFDLMADFAQQLPVGVICGTPGLPAADFALTKVRPDAPARLVEPLRRRADLEAAGRSAQDMAGYLGAHGARLHCRPRDDDPADRRRHAHAAAAP